MPRKTTIADGSRMTREQRREIAVGIFDGSIFTSAQVEDPAMIPHVFYVLLLLDDAQRAALKQRDIRVFYAKMEDAHSRAINGYPMFPSVQIMGKTDWEEVRKMTLKLTEAAKNL